MLKLAPPRTVLTTCLDHLLPHECVLCCLTLPPGSVMSLCTHCATSLPEPPPSCLRCALPLPRNGRCGACVYRAFLPDPAGRVVAALPHRDAPRYLVHRLKYQQGVREGAVLAEHIVARVVAAYRGEPLPTALVPVPLSWWRQYRRGYNQATILARHVARALHLDVHERLFVRRHRTPQQDLVREARLALPATDIALRRRPSDAHIAIVDDVITTGRTVGIIAEHLWDAGVTRIDAWCATRAA